jgi:hypothetical protein
MMKTEVVNPVLQQDYYQGIAALDPVSKDLPIRTLDTSQQQILRKLVDELKTSGLEPARRYEILEHMQHFLEGVD